jgi:hypothetical protein
MKIQCVVHRNDNKEEDAPDARNVCSVSPTEGTLVAAVKCDHIHIEKNYVFYVLLLSGQI